MRPRSPKGPRYSFSQSGYSTRPRTDLGWCAPGSFLSRSSGGKAYCRVRASPRATQAQKDYRDYIRKALKGRRGGGKQALSDAAARWSSQ